MSRRALSAVVVLSGTGGYRNVWLRPPSPWWRARKVGDVIRSKASGSVYSVGWILVEDADPPLAEPVLVPGVGEWETTGATLPRV